MYCMLDVCFLCLDSYKESRNLVEKQVSDNDKTTEKQIFYVLPELDVLDMDTKVPLRICSRCNSGLHTFYQFKKVCLENISQWKFYKQILKEASSYADHHSFDDLNRKINTNKLHQNNSLSQEKEEVEDSSIFVKPEPSEHCDIEIKEEIFTDDIEDTEFYENLVNNCELSGNELNRHQVENIGMFYGFDKNDIDLKCLTCNKTFSNKNRLHTHTKCDKSLKRIECNICHKFFLTKRYLNKHKKIHSGVKDFECSICNKKFARNGHLKTHMLVHTGLKNFECLICDKKFARKFTLTMHMAVHTGIKNHKCLVCNKKFSYKSDLKKHLSVHTGEKKFQCLICKKRFKQSGHLKAHTNTCNVDKNSSILTSKVIECYICSRKFSRKSHLKNHMTVHTGLKMFECPVCNKKFSRSDNLKTHMKIHSHRKSKT